jgi:hypothetical protein
MDGMKKYMYQLIEDIQESAANIDKNAEQFYVPMPKGVPEHLHHLPVIPMKKAHQWFNLPLEAFPPAEKWNEYQLLYMCVLLRQLFEHYHIEVEIPNHMPYNLVYGFLLKALDTYTTCQPEESTLDQITFCECEEDTCPFGKYCAKENEYSCDTWIYGNDWAGYHDLEEMEKNKEDE